MRAGNIIFGCELDFLERVALDGDGTALSAKGTEIAIGIESSPRTPLTKMLRTGLINASGLVRAGIPRPTPFAIRHVGH